LLFDDYFAHSIVFMVNTTFIPQEPAFVEMVREKIGGNHFTNHIGFNIHTIEAGRVEGELDLAQHHLQQMEFVHGGVTSSLSDIVAGFAAFTLVKKGHGVVTVELKVSYLNPGQGEKLTAKGYVIKAGSKLFFCESEIYSHQGESMLLIAKASATMALVKPEDFNR
jgi:uncharacterized protein (TIGR00369 family)